MSWSLEFHGACSSPITDAHNTTDETEVVTTDTVEVRSGHVATRRSKFLKVNGPTSRMKGDCAVEDCERPLFRKGYCVTHLKRFQRTGSVAGGPINGGLPLGEVLSPEESTVIAGTAFLDASSEDDRDHKTKRRLFLKAAARWLESLGWKPPHASARRLRKV